MFEQKMASFFDFIELNLTDDIKFEVFEKEFLISIEDIKTVFPLLFNITLSQYIRNRRLSEAGKDFLLTDQRIIDIAFKYCYSSPISFSRAFAKYHGVLPSKINTEGIQLNYFPKLSFNFSEKKHPTKYEIVECENIQIVGVSGTVQKNQITEEVLLLRNLLFENLVTRMDSVNLANCKIYQCCENFDKDVFDLVIGIESDISTKFDEPTCSLSSYTIKKGRYFQFSYLISDTTVIPGIWQSLVNENMEIDSIEYETIQRRIDHNSNIEFIYQLYISIDNRRRIDAN